ncbi:MAG TPA: hypothetical protein VL263_06335 [Vicinamibacterales bacterium]|nr:hypothetical protein [Vicinamibacterales bacterium]
MKIRRTGIAVLKSRRWSVLIPTALGLLVGLSLTQLLPQDYVATATLSATPSQPLNELTSADALPERRLVDLSKELLSEPFLAQVARDENLVGGDSMDEVVATLRSRTSVSLAPPKSPTATDETATLVLSYRAPTPELAERIASRMIQRLEQRSRTPKSGEPEATLIAKELAASRTRLEQAERDAKSASELPDLEQATAARRTAAELRHRLQSDTDALSRERERLAGLDQQIGVAQQQAAASAAAAQSESREHVNTLEQQLAEARKQYTSQHPTVQRLELDLAQARADERAAEIQSPRTESNVRRLMDERDQSNDRVQELGAAVERNQAELKRLDARIGGGRLAEQRLASASAAYDAAKQEFQRLDEQYQQSVKSEDTAPESRGESTAVLSAASLSVAPASPNRVVVLAGSLAAGFVLGLLWALGRELLDATFYDGRTLEAKFGKTVLIEIPHL